MDVWPAAVPVESVGVVTLVLLFAIGLATNRLYTRGQVRAIEQAHEREIKRMEDAHTRELEDAQHERNEWRTETRLEHQAVLELTEQNRMLQTFGETLADFLENMRRLAGMRRAEERDHA